jgi:ABC-type phosphate transport system substrate-binding protein
MVRNTTVAAAVAAALASSAAMAGQPTPSQAAAPTVGLYIAGSSAAKNAVLNTLENSASFCGGSYSLFSSTGNTNFFAVSCTPAASTGLPGANGSNVYTIWYRDEGGSVVGALPLVSGSSINQLSLAGASGSAGSYTVAVGGSSGTNGIDDSFTGGVSPQPVQAGIVDVEPGALVANNYPSAYKTSVYGHATGSQLANLTATTIFDQVFGIFVNNKSSPVVLPATLNLTRAEVGAILQGLDTNWNLVGDTSGNAIASGSQAITIVNREQGSGSRTATDIFFTSDHCVASPAQPPIKESTGGTADYFSTGNVLAAANTIPGSITYASIDNAGTSFPNLTLVNVDGITPSNLNAAIGLYGDWYEATVVTGSNFSSLSADQQALINNLVSAFQGIGTTASAVDIVANPSYNSVAFPVSGTGVVPNGGTKTVYVGEYTRNGNSCNDPYPAI